MATHRDPGLSEIAPLCTRVLYAPYPFFEAIPPGAAPGHLVKTGARARPPMRTTSKAVLSMLEVILSSHLNDAFFFPARKPLRLPHISPVRMPLGATRQRAAHDTTGLDRRINITRQHFSGGNGGNNQESWRTDTRNFMGRIMAPKRKSDKCRGAKLRRVDRGEDPIRACANWRTATDLLRSLMNHGNHTFEEKQSWYVSAVQICARNNQSVKALELLSEMHSLQMKPLSSTLVEIIANCKRTAQWRAACDIIDTMEAKFSMRPSAKMVSSAILACEKGGQWDKALELYDRKLKIEKMQGRGMKLNVATSSAVLNACEKSGHWVKALEVFESLEGCGGQQHVNACNLVISTCGNGGEWAKALEVFESMACRGLKPNMATFVSAISACGNGGQCAKAVELFESMKNGELEPDIIACNALISACEKSAQWAKAIEVFESIQGRGLEPNTRTFNSVISACEKGGQWAKALEVFESMAGLGLEPDVITCSAVISACEKGGQWAKALEVFDSMAGRGLEPNVVTYSAAISACGNCGEWAKALELFESMAGHGSEPNAVTFNAIIEALDSALQPEIAIDIARDPRFHGFYPRARLLDGVVDLHSCSAAVSRSVIGGLLKDFRAGRIGCQDVIIVTGRGKHSESGKAVIPDDIRSFLLQVDGPTVTEVPRNPGRFILSARHLQDWIAGACVPC